MKRQLRLRRVYDDPSPEDGVRVLVDRVWPRGLTKAAVHLDEWVKDIAPSTQLRRWYGHRPERFAEFRRRYLIELREAQPAATVDRLRKLARTRPVTLLTARQPSSSNGCATRRHPTTRRPIPPARSDAPAPGTSDLRSTRTPGRPEHETPEHPAVAMTSTPGSTGPVRQPQPFGDGDGPQDWLRAGEALGLPTGSA
jgi:uncharacterized protein YeaO (DUF488 family)